MADSDKLGLGLDDIIRNDRTTNRRGSRGGKQGFGGRNNGFRARGGGELPRTFNAPAGRWKHDLFDDNTNRARGGGGQRTSGVNSTTKLLLSNLDYGVTTSDIQELFEDIGALRVARVHYDENGQSLGTAEIVFERRADAVNAQQKYNGLNLDGRAMDIRLVSGVDDGSQPQSNRGTFSNGNQRSGFRNNQQNGTRGRSRGGGSGDAKQNGINGHSKKENVTVEDLDAELDAYRADNAPKK